MDRDAQFHYINDQAKAFLAANEPAISVDTKKKELVGNFKNNGREWHPEAVNVHDFIDPKLGRAIPYGVYDIADHKGWGSVGTDHDTANFAVHAIHRWWPAMGQKRYPKASRLMITADGGGSNGHRPRLWKIELQRLANELRIPITVCHLPPGTSKWNKIEHRLFSFITLHGRGKLLRSFKTMVQLIAATTTTTGLTVRELCDQAVVGVRQGENGKESESCFASRAEATTNPNPVVTLVMSLFAPSAMADDRIAQTRRTKRMISSPPAAAQSKSGLQSFPESGIKRIVLLGGSLAERTRARISAQKRAFLPPAKISTKRTLKDNPPFLRLCCRGLAG
jgi:hypothetical protein